MKSLTVGIVIMRPKIQWMSIHMTDIMYRAMKFERFSKPALLVVFVWESTSVKNAISLMMRTQNNNTTVTDVEFAELEATIISSTVINVDVATLSAWRIATLVWKKQCTTTALCVLRFACPVCSKFVCDMSKLWGKLDREVSLTPMPEAYQNKMVWILCNDCGVTSEVIIHIVAHKCQSCNSYNTRQTRGGPFASSCRSHLWYSQMFRFMYPSLPLVRLLTLIMWHEKQLYCKLLCSGIL